MLHDRYPVPIEEVGIPCSDCAAEVVGTGSMVEGFAIGDRVAAIADLGNLAGHDVTPAIAVGANSPGVLREYAIFEDTHLVLLPKHMSWEEVSCS
jgi:NADPH:quinone reductase-like Zn-dependent oxidoreductase